MNYKINKNYEVHNIVFQKWVVLILGFPLLLIKNSGLLTWNV
ncbi:Uncharacterized protein dnl_16430 [Desulfonema limicola]|uniref:Uncharacterized protein n=1 Tax=Desulfonema limicola TaxID=45656 RepID=A0A975B5W1_9BACT|nr:Uncharacterized protein dnl_16430 [Desulfonema limicola]